MSNFKAYHIVKENGVEEIINETSYDEQVWEWFPELKRFCTHNFNVNELIFDIDLSKIEGIRDSVERIYFKIVNDINTNET
jgi:hypothetical protein